MSTETGPATRTAADVLREHGYYEDMGDTTRWYCCVGCPAGLSSNPTEVGRRLAEHQADMLAAAGLLVTDSLVEDILRDHPPSAEHDRGVAERTCAILQRLRGGDVEQEYIDHAISAAGESA